MVQQIRNWFTAGNRMERIWMMAKIEFKLRYYENKLGLLWALIKPVFIIFKFYLVFQIIFGQKLENFAIYVFTGLLLWQFFVETTNGGVKLFKVKQYLYEYTNMNKIEIYLSYMVSSTIGLLFNLGILFVGLLVVGIYPNPLYPLFILIYINLFILSLGTALILSNLYLIFKDITQIWELVLAFGFFLSPIFIRGDLFTEKLPLLNYLNPISGIIINARNILMYNTMIDWNLYFFDMAYSLFILMVGLYCLKTISYRASELV